MCQHSFQLRFSEGEVEVLWTCPQCNDDNILFNANTCITETDNAYYRIRQAYVKFLTVNCSFFSSF